MRGTWRLFRSSHRLNGPLCTTLTPVRDLVVVHGLLWAARDGGLIVWDTIARDTVPVRFKPKQGLAANRITGLAVAQDPEMGIDTVSVLFHFKGQRWLRLTTADELADNQINHVLILPDGAVWVVKAGGLSRSRPKAKLVGVCSRRTPGAEVGR